MTALIELEEIGIPNVGDWRNMQNGDAIRRRAINLLPTKLEKFGLHLSADWQEALKRSDIADDCEFGERGLENVVSTITKILYNGKAELCGWRQLPLDTVDNSFSFSHPSKLQAYQERVKIS